MIQMILKVYSSTTTNVIMLRKLCIMEVMTDQFDFSRKLSWHGNGDEAKNVVSQREFPMLLYMYTVSL